MMVHLEYAFLTGAAVVSTVGFRSVALLAEARRASRFDG